MMCDLTTKSCEVCRKGAPPVSDQEMVDLLRSIADWQVIEVDSVKRLQRPFTFKNFVSALAFTNAVGELAESQGHHPTIVTEWGKVTISWWTHKIGGLHQNDFIMAAKTDALYENG